MTDLNLAGAVQAAATALLRDNETSSEYHNYDWTWKDFEPAARSAIEAALPHIREQIERQTRETAARELLDWAGKPVDDEPLHGPRAARRRHIRAAAQRISPKPSNDEIIDALHRGDFIACHLDDAGRPIQKGQS